MMPTTLSLTEDVTPRPALPAWRSLLEERWQHRLNTLTELALAYHDAEESVSGGPAGDAEIARLQRLLRQATAARRALGDTEAALARLSDGSFGRCEQCSGSIPAAELLAEPETRYCAECVAGSWVALAG
jgi:DnaK suppressor protein